MSEILAAARIALDGPLPVKPLYGLLSVAQEQTSPNPTDRGGALITPYPAAMPDANDPCGDGTFRTKDTPSSLVMPDGFNSWTAYLGEICTTYSIGPWDAWKARANLALAAKQSWALERQLANAQFAAGPNMNDADVDIVGGGAVAAAVAIGYLEGEIAATGIAGVLHVTPQVVAFLGFNNFIVDRGVLRTAAGTPVICGAGYVGAGTPTGGGAAVAGQSWIYATGPVQYAQSSTIFNLPDTIQEATDRSDNTVIYRAERDLWVGWDKQLQAACLADWSP